MRDVNAKYGDLSTCVSGMVRMSHAKAPRRKGLKSNNHEGTKSTKKRISCLLAFFVSFVPLWFNFILLGAFAPLRESLLRFFGGDL